MARDSRSKAMEKRKKLEPGHVECYYCGEAVRSAAMRCPHCGKWYSSGKKFLALAVASVIMLAAVGAYYLIPGSPGYQQASEFPVVLSKSPTGVAILTTSPITVDFDREMNHTSVEAAFSVGPITHGTFSWTEKSLTFTPSQPLLPDTFYSVTIQETATDINGKPLEHGFSWQFTTAASGTTGLRSIGTGEDEFWSRSVSHPSWVLVGLQTRPQLILTHSTGCAPCDAMIAICDPLSVEYAGQMDYYNITSQIDEPEATDCFAAYDPAEPHYVPLTTIVTKGPDGAIIWHSWEGVVDEVTMSGWIDDAISYHELYG